MFRKSGYRFSEKDMRQRLKLRWIGLDDEANRLQRIAQSFAREQRPIVLSEPANTD